MSSRLLLCGTLASAALRRKRRADGAVFAIGKIRDTDRGERRQWTVYVNDPAVIELLEEMRVGEPLAVSGPFTISITGPEREPSVEYKITAETVLDTKRKKKPKGLIGKEQRIESDEFDLAPADGGPNDALPF
jgi:hypothetical protein